MPKKIKVPNEILEAAIEAARTAQTADDLRMAQTIILPSLLGVSDQATGDLLGRSRGSVLRLRAQFKRRLAGDEPAQRNWGGRRCGYMSIEEESQFLSRFFDEAAQGGVLCVSEIKSSFEALVGRKVAKTTIYRMLDRHGWRKIMPRPHHPKSDPKARDGFKKTPQSGAPMC